MCDKSRSSVGSLLTGLTVGAMLGAGAAILFGTKKGKELQIKIKKQYPEVFNKIEDTLDEVKENFDDKVEEVKDEVKKEIKQIKQIGAPKKRFVKNGRKL
ncbi:MAG: YtxH domain-containing protein [Patescibacteria group bacterium]